MYYRIGVHISTQNGKFFRLNDAVESTATPAIAFEENLLTYPDRQVKEFTIYGRAGTSGDWSYKTFEATPSLSANLSYTDIGGGLNLADLTGGTITDVNLVATPQLNEKDSNRVLVSDTYKPRAYLGRRAQTVGDGAADGVLLFAVNAEEISQGQFGQYPTFAFCEHSRFAMEVGSGGVAFSRISPDESNRGVIGRNAAINIGKVIAYLAKDGLRSLPGNRLISEPIQDSSFPEDILANISSETSLAYYVDVPSGREEIWVAGNIAGQGRMYCFSLKHGCWFTLGVVRRRLISVIGRTLGIGTDGKIYEESGIQIGTSVAVET